MCSIQAVHGCEVVSRAHSLSNHALAILSQRYLKPGENPDDLFRRVAENIALADLLYDPEIELDDVYAGVFQDEIPADDPRSAVLRLLHQGDKVDMAHARCLQNLIRKELLRDSDIVRTDDTVLSLLDEVAARVLSGDYETNFRIFLTNLSRQASASRRWRQTADKFFEAMASLEFLPNSPTLMNAGTRVQQLSACFVLPVPDDLNGIYQTLAEAARIQKAGGGTGFSFSELRPRGDLIHSSGGVSSGPVSMMQIFDASTEEIKKGGRRRGANMGVLRIDHPDILEFIDCKRQDGRLNNFNISVAVTDSFMEAVQTDRDYDLIHPVSGDVLRRTPARKVFARLVESAWRHGDPGILFIDRIEGANPTPETGRICATNPCGEQPLLPGESSNLGSINLSRMVTDGQVDYPKLSRIVTLAVHFLDNVIDVNRYPSRNIEQKTKANRKIGLGVMGLANLLARLEIPYASEKGRALAGQVMGFIHRCAREASCELARERGRFPNWQQSIFNCAEMAENLPLRHATLTTVAPTGVISTLADCWGGIEPFFSLAWTRRIMDGLEMTEMNGELQQSLEKHGLVTDEILEQITATGSVQGIAGVPSDLQAVFATANEISPQDHIQMQAVFQRHCDNAVSKTINLGSRASIETVRDCFVHAWISGLKGITVFRDGCKSEQVYTHGNR